jgi:hypothetical protein
MATTVNARDAILQAANPRVLPVNLPSNVNVPSGQVEGFPALALNSKVIFLRATSQVFQIPKSGAAATPASINFTPLFRNVSGTVSWLVTAGTATLTDDGSGGKNLAIANLTTDSATIKVSVIDGGVTYSDTITVVKLREGSDTLNVVLSNESHTIPADSNGLPTSYSGASTSVSIFSGTTDVTAQWVISKTDGLGVTSSLSGNVITVTEMQASYSGSYVDITATKSGQPTITRRFSLSKTKSGTNGTNGGSGSRGSFSMYISGSTWDDGAANNAIWGATGSQGIRQVGDTVTISNGTNFAKTKYWSGVAWVEPGVVIDGNLLVKGTVSATTLYGTLVGGMSINISGNFIVNGTTGMSQLYTANLTRCTASNGDAPGISALIATSSGTGAAVHCNGDLTGTGTVGRSGSPWSGMYSSTALVVTSDARTKDEVQDSDLGLAFITSLRPVSFRIKESGIRIEQGPELMGPWQENEKPVFEIIQTVIQGTRRHYGLLAQDVKVALGDRDAAIWCSENPDDVDSRQALRYEELIAPLIKAVQELAAENKQLKEGLRLLRVEVLGS